jgi:hypothetical protein
MIRLIIEEISLRKKTCQKDQGLKANKQLELETATEQLAIIQDLI